MVAIIVFLTGKSFAQDRFGFEVGIAQPFTYYYRNSGLFSPVERQISQPKPYIGINYLRKVSKHVYFGGKIYWETYSFKRDSTVNTDPINLFGPTGPIYKTEVTFRSSYLFLAPQMDIGLGKHQYLHFYIMPALGLLVNGNQSTRINESGASGVYFDSTRNTSGTIKEVILQLNFGLVQHIPLNNMWHLTVSESLSSIPSFIPLSEKSGTNNMLLSPGGFSLQIGIMRKYHRYAK